MNIQAYFSSREQSAEKPTQQPMHASTSAGAQGFQEPKPPRTPERPADQSHHNQHSSQRAQSLGAGLSKRKSDSKRQRVLHPNQHSAQHQSQSNQQQYYQQPIQTQSEQFIGGTNVSNSQQPQAENVNYGTGSKRGADGWPSPATTHLGMHMQNVHAQSNHFVSPLLPSKQLFQETTNTVIHHNPHFDQANSSYQYRPLLTASHRQGQETAIASESQQQDQQQQQEQPPYQHQINNENNRPSSSPMTNKTTKNNQQSNTSFDNFGCAASQSQQDQGSTSIGASRSWIYPQHQMTQNHNLTGPLGDHLVDEHHQFLDDFGPTNTMIGPPDIQDSALSMIDGSNQHEFGGVTAGVPPDLPYSSYYSSSYYGHPPPPAPHRYYATGYSNRAGPPHHPYDQYGPRGYHHQSHHQYPPHSYHHAHNMHQQNHTSEQQQHAIYSSRPAQQYYYDSQYGGPTMQSNASQQASYHNSSGSYYPMSGAAPNGTSSSSQAYHQNSKQYHAQRSMGYIDNQQAASSNRQAGPVTCSSAQQYLNEEFMYGNSMMPHPQQQHGPPLAHHNMHPYASAPGHHHMPHYPYNESSSPQHPQHQHQSNHLMIPVNMRSPHHPHHHKLQQHQHQQCPQQYSSLSVHKSASKQQQSGQKYRSGSSARRNQSSSQRKQRHTPNNNNCNGDALLPQTHQQVGQGQPYQLEARQLLFERNADENRHYCAPQTDSQHAKYKQHCNNHDVIYPAPADSNQNPQSNSQFDHQNQYSEFETVKIKVNKAQNDQKQQQSAFSRCVPYKSEQQCLTEQHLKEANHYNQDDEISNVGEQQLLDNRPTASNCHNNDSQLQKHRPSASSKPRKSQGAGATATSIDNSSAGAATRRQDRQSSLLHVSKLLSSRSSDAGDNQDDLNNLNFSNAAPDIAADSHHQPQSVHEHSSQKLAPNQPNYDGNFCEPDMKPQQQVQQQCYDHTKLMVSASGKPISGNQNRDAAGISCVASSMMEQASSSVYNSTLQSGQTLTNNSKRRSYVYNEESGRYERVIRKRKRKSAFQLNELATYFNNDPHWSKETLLTIALKTGLTEAQVYKWGWDQKRKQFGVEEAERMRKYENILDQQNAKKAANKQLALADIASRKQQTSFYPDMQQYDQNHHQIIELVEEPQPQQKFNSGRAASSGSRAAARGSGADGSGSLDRLGLLNASDADNNDVQRMADHQPSQMAGQQLRSIQKKRKHHNNPELTPEHGTASRGQPGCSSPPQDSNDLLASSMTGAIGKMPTKTYMASAEQDYFRSNANHQNEDGEEPDDDRKRVSAFSEIEQQPPRQQMTVKKPSNALKNTESLQKSATTNANTGALHYTPMEKQNKLYDTGALLQEDNNDSDKFTPEVANRRVQKQQGKDAAKLRKYLPLSNGQECSVSGTPHSSKGQANVIEPRQTRQRTSIMANSDKSPAAVSSSYDTRSQRSSKRLQIRAAK